MRKLCPKNDNENGLETVLEMPMPEEIFTDTGIIAMRQWQHVCDLVRPNRDRFDKLLAALLAASGGQKNEQFMHFLKIVGSSFIPFQVQLDHALALPVKDGSIEACTAKYIVQHYIAATGGSAALNSVNSMYAVGQVNMAQSQIHDDDQESRISRQSGEPGAFVLWQKNPNSWYLELVVSGCKVSAGSDGTVAWSQSSLKRSQASRGPPKPHRRFFQGLDPRSTVNLFLNAVCIGEQTIMNEDCFILKLEASPDLLKEQSKANTETVHHTIWGYFSQRTGLLFQFEDTKLIKMSSTKKGCDQYVYYETSMESSLEDYRYVEGINIAHYGKTTTLIYRYGHGENVRWKVEDTSTIQHVEFNICGLPNDSFLPPVDVKN